MKILVFVEQRDNKLKKSAFEALAAARKLAGSASQVAALLVGGSVEGLAGELKNYGADTVYVVNNAAFDKYNVMAYAAAAEQAIKTFAPKLVLGIASPMGRDIFPRLAARFDAGLATDLIEIKANGDFITGLKPMYSGKVFAELALQNTELQFATLRPNVFKGETSGDGAANVSKLDVAAPASPLQTVEIRKGKSEKVDLTEATLIISGGRALGSADAFKILHEAADVIGATVGASRAAVDAGYAAHDMQVGQTGKTVNPTLYIAAGISGSIQHMAGMRSSKVIVAINTDPEAPIFKIANYGIIGDLFQVVPAMTKAFKELKG
ncbi:electron transfer flavoprotein subunit alpha/FixB family protein [Oligoflexus tunisiensis]|uniref:electron transfer flavoprotein subunit alpha/FixB family protein n=1 Tax=Oligoflexus tunisiensis TaxID=708132 RepID=UPI000AB6C22F|nr:electron transfer flavoprotein subunit alpha/FixB family protein [Oligoflexus tunisiensis]